VGISAKYLKYQLKLSGSTEMRRRWVLVFDMINPNPLKRGYNLLITMPMFPLLF
jgi:hypothetical protein